VSGAERIAICDVGPRDGLQNESRTLEPPVRAELCNRLARAGLPRVEAVSFVNAVRVPQMAGAEEVIDQLERGGGTIFAGLIVNERGYDRALGVGVDEVHYAFPATDTFCERNQGMTLADASALAERLVDRARGDGLRITVTIGASFGCPFEGAVAPQRVFALAERIQAHEPTEIVLADTIGVGVPSQVRELVGGVAALGARVGVHLHNTRNTGYANALAAVEAGVCLLDASCGGIGGCPFAPQATGNIATEDLVYLLHGMGYQTGIDLAEMLATAAWLAEAMGKDLPGQTYKAGAFAPVAA
jgi:isopropylmalate/homocitrate/citramalate synthase